MDIGIFLGTGATFSIRGNNKGGSSFGSHSAGAADTGLHFYLTKLEFVPGPDQLTLWIDPPLVSSEADLPAYGARMPFSDNYNVGGGLSWFTFANPAFIPSGPQPVTFVIDEVRIGETVADVMPIPEPSCLLLLGLGAAVGIIRTLNRYRRRSDSRCRQRDIASLDWVLH